MEERLRETMEFIDGLVFYLLDICGYSSILLLFMEDNPRIIIVAVYFSIKINQYKRRNEPVSRPVACQIAENTAIKVTAQQKRSF